MRAAAEVGEGAVGVQRDCLQPLPAPADSRRARDRRSAPPCSPARSQEARARVGDREVLALEALRRLDVRAHPLFDRREVGLGDARPRRETRSRSRSPARSPARSRSSRPGRAPSRRARARARRRGGSAAAAPRPRERAVRIAIRRRRAAAVRGRAPRGRSPSLRPRHPAADLHRQRRARQAGADRGGRIGAGGAVGKLQSVAVGECDRDAHRALEATCPPPRWLGSANLTRPQSAERPAARALGSGRLGGVKPAATARRHPGQCAARDHLRPARSARAPRRCGRGGCCPAP